MLTIWTIWYQGACWYDCNYKHRWIFFSEKLLWKLCLCCLCCLCCAMNWCIMWQKLKKLPNGSRAVMICFWISVMWQVGRTSLIIIIHAPYNWLHIHIYSAHLWISLYDETSSASQVVLRGNRHITRNDTEVSSAGTSCIVWI